MKLDAAQTDADFRTAVAGPQGDQVKSGFTIHLAEAGALSSLRSLHMDSGIESAFHVVLVAESAERLILAMTRHSNFADIIGMTWQ